MWGAGVMVWLEFTKVGFLEKLTNILRAHPCDPWLIQFRPIHARNAIEKNNALAPDNPARNSHQIQRPAPFVRVVMKVARAMMPANLRKPGMKKRNRSFPGISPGSKLTSQCPESTPGVIGKNFR